MLIHGDLWYENLLLDPVSQRLNGLLDFEQAAWGDPAQDFAPLFYLGAAFVRHTMNAYARGGGAVDASFSQRVQRYWEVREFEGLHFAIRHNDPAELADALAKLQNGPILRRSS